MRFAVWLTWRARSRSNPVSIARAEPSWSASAKEGKVRGMVRAAVAITAASRLSVSDLPGVRSAIRRIDNSGRQATRIPSAWATATASAPMVAYLADHHQYRAVFGQLLVDQAQFGLVVWQSLIQ